MSTHITVQDNDKLVLEIIRFQTFEVLRITGYKVTVDPQHNFTTNKRHTEIDIHYTTEQKDKIISNLRNLLHRLESKE